MFVQDDQCSPTSIKQAHQLSEIQYMWTLCKSLSRQQRWPDIVILFTKRSLIGQSKISTPMPASYIIELLAKYNAPNDVCCTFMFAFT
jgi:hypothetical protein